MIGYHIDRIVRALIGTYLLAVTLQVLFGIDLPTGIAPVLAVAH